MKPWSPETGARRCLGLNGKAGRRKEISGGRDQFRKAEQLAPLEVWCCMVRAGPLDTLQLFFTPFGEVPVGNGPGGGGRAGRSCEAART